MKKFTAVLTVAILLVFTTLFMAACGSKKPAPTVAPSQNPSVEVSVMPTETPSVTPSAAPTITPSVEESATPSVAPTTTPSVEPPLEESVAPSVEPTETPTIEPSVEPSVEPTETPTIEPSIAPSVEPPVDPEESLVADYVQKYADYDAADAWLIDHINTTNVPPVSFLINGIHSSSIGWKKEVGAEEVFFDFANSDPAERRCREIVYTATSLKMQVVLTLTTYPGYPIVEYDAYLVNNSITFSGVVSNMLSIDGEIENKEGSRYLHANRGSTCSFNDFAPLTYYDFNGTTLSVTNGKPTSTYMPNFNIENKIQNTGTIAVLNWQGNWKAEFTETAESVSLRAGQYETNFVMKSGETMRFPGAVLLFYKGDYINGQNVYRRWLEQCNMFRKQGEKMERVNILACSAQNSEVTDLAELALYRETGLIDLLTKYNLDGGWYDTEGHDWTFTGNWFVDPEKYPNNIKAIADVVHQEGLQFAVWFEPERIVMGTDMANDLREIQGALLAVASDGTAADVYNFPKGASVLVNLAKGEVVNYIINMLDAIITENGIDQYRQDFNMMPADSWAAWDKSESIALNMPRTGVTENQYTGGYLAIFDGLLERHPGIFIDACASGGMRYDLETLRYSFMHTRSDYWVDDESAQCQTYGSAMWTLYWGTGFNDLSTYNVRSHIGNSIGVGASTIEGAYAVKDAIIEWKDLSTYLFYDYYPLTVYTPRAPLAMQFDSPEDGCGMFITYFRNAGKTTVYPRALDPNAVYYIWDRDNAETVMEKTGAAIMQEGFALSASGKA
ncbi:MAG: alpha-galactosidase, partial [Clostridia bacterium]|nr:alpha-galactosidase [Clostridia bacterium]